MTTGPSVLQLNVAPDHVASLTKFRNPILGIEELVWNALDADATLVEIIFQTNGLGGLEAIVIKDDGLGMDPATKDQAFGNLGGSVKRNLARTKGGRVVHGKEGKGRFRAFRLGGRVEWKSRAKTTAGLVEWTVTGDSFDLTKFQLGQPTPTTATTTGTKVTITNVDPAVEGQLSSENCRKELLVRLAIYLRKYPLVTVVFAGTVLDVRGIFSNEASYDVATLDGNLTAKLNIIEWKTPVDRKLYLCTTDGFARFEEPPGIQAKGYDFTAYIMTAAVEGMHEHDVDLVEMRPELTALREAAKQRLREHFKERETARLRALVDQWKAEGIYPYQEAPASPVAEAEREVFNICAISVHERLPAFEKSDVDNKKLTMRLLKQALESNPGSLQTILKEVLNLPKQGQDDLADLLQRTKLSSIIKAAKVVGDRLTFIQSLRYVLFDTVMNKKLKERSQLQRILVNELWIFGEQYVLGLDDQGLKVLLEKHSELLGRPVLAADVVKDINGDDAIPDLMLYKKFADRTKGQYEHLVIELKRPSVKIGSDELAQIKKYAFTVANDPRFEKGQTKWSFVAVSTDFDDVVEAEAQQNQRAYGHVHASDNINIHVAKWGGVIQDCEWRHEFYRKELDIEIQAEDATAYLRKRYPNYVPPLPTDPAAVVVPDPAIVVVPVATTPPTVAPAAVATAASPPAATTPPTVPPAASG